MRKAIIIAILVIVVIGAWLAYKEYNRTNENLAQVAAAATTDAASLLRAFESDSAAANRQYLGKVVAVTGPVKAVEREEGAATIVLGEAGTMSSVRCSMDTTELTNIASIKEGQRVTVKGYCTGFNQDDLLGSDVLLNRCVVESKP